MQVFDRMLKRMHRDASSSMPDAGFYHYLKAEVTSRLLDRLEDMHRTSPVVLNLGGNGEHAYPSLCDSRSGVQLIVNTDLSSKALHKTKTEIDAMQVTRKVRHVEVQADEEAIPFADNTFDAVVSSLALHWVNDIPGCLIQIERVLKPDGVFLGAMLGGDTLKELRISLTLAQQERESGISPYVSPMAGFRDAGNLLGRAGFSLPTVDVDTITVPYPDAFTLMQHLWGMGESNAIPTRRGQLKRDTLTAAAAIYQDMFGDGQGGVLATFQVMYLIGWKYDPSQPQAKRRGSGSVSMQTLAKDLGVAVGETDTGDRTE
jgi:NADH dehydrogenase [ubiquinone] 1 alpha subcomplex assembly factor 5